MRPKSEFPQTFDFEHIVTESEQAADLEELKQLVLSDTAISRHVAPRLRLLRLIEKRYSIKFRMCKGYTITHWIEKLECGHEHHVYQVEDLTAKRRNCPTCAKAAQLQNADELVQTLQDSTSTGGRCCAADAESQETRGGLIEAQLTTGTDGNGACLGSAPSALDKSQVLTPPKQPSQSVLRHKEKSA